MAFNRTMEVQRRDAAEKEACRCCTPEQIVGDFLGHVVYLAIMAPMLDAHDAVASWGTNIVSKRLGSPSGSGRVLKILALYLAW